MASPCCRKIFMGTFVHTPTLKAITVLENAAVYVDQNGKIDHIDHNIAAEDARINNDLGEWSGAEIVYSRRGENSFFFPGFVDTHIHAAQYSNAGVFGDSTLLEWLERYTFPMEASLADLNKAHQIYGRCIARTLANGTTTASYFGTAHSEATNVLANLCLRAGQRAFIGRCCMDRNVPDWYTNEDWTAAVKSVEETVRYCREIDPEGKIVCPIITPRFAPTCTAELMSALGDLARRENLPVQTHLSENKPEVEWVQYLFPKSRNYSDVYDTCGLLTSRTILAHGVHLTDEEIALIKERDSKISHCPVSNMALGSGFAKVKALMNAGITVGLGTDMSGGYSASILEAVRQTTLTSRIVALQDGDDEAKLSVAEALFLGTRGGAEAVGLGDKIGAFEVGMEWDAILVELGKVPELPVDDDRLTNGNADQVPLASVAAVDVSAAVGVDDEYINAFPPLDIAETDDTKYNGPDIDIDSTSFPPQICDGINDNPVDIFGWENWEEKIAKWVYSGDSRNNIAVWVRGSEVYRRGGMPEVYPLSLEEGR